MRAAVQGAGPAQRPPPASIRRLTYSRRSGSCGAPWSGGPGPRPRNRGARRAQPVPDNCAASSTQPWPAAPSPLALPCRGSACTSSAWSRRRPASRTPLSARAPVRGNSACIRKQAAAVSSRWRAPRRWHTRRPPASRRRVERVRRRASWSSASWWWWSAESSSTSWSSWWWGWWWWWWWWWSWSWWWWGWWGGWGGVAVVVVGVVVGVVVWVVVAVVVVVVVVGLVVVVVVVVVVDVVVVGLVVVVVG